MRGPAVRCAASPTSSARLRSATGTTSLRPNAPAASATDSTPMGTNSRQKLTPPALAAVIS